MILGDSKKDSGIKSVLGLLILIITILAFRDMVKDCVTLPNANQIPQALPGTGISLLNAEGILALFGCFITLAVVMGIGWILDSNFGAFSIGWIIFGIISGKIVLLNHPILKRWVMEGIIIVSTFCNQTSPQSSNAGALISNSDEDSRNIQIEAWKVKSFFGITAFVIQLLAMLICVVLSGVLTALGIN